LIEHIICGTTGVRYNDQVFNVRRASERWSLPAAGAFSVGFTALAADTDGRLADAGAAEPLLVTWAMIRSATPIAQ